MGINKDSQKAPNLRFKVFTDDWEQRKWSETVDISTEMVNPKTGEYDSLPHIGPGNIESFTGRILDNVKSVKEDNLISGKFHFYPGDVIYGKINPQLGKYAMVDFEGLASADSYVLNTKNGVSQTFLFTILQGTSFYKYSVSVSMRTGMPKINRDELNQYSYSAPSVVEQEKIGHFFKQLDDTIALHQRKLDQLNQLKEALLQQMFPGKGETVPKLRFAGFEGDWEELKLSAVVDKQIKGKAQADKLNPGTVEYLDTARLNGGEPFLTDGISNVMKNDILILWDGSKAGTVYIGFEGTLGSTLKAYRTSSDSQFVFQYLKRYQEHIYNNYRTPNIPHVQKDFLEVFTIKVPTMKEQTKIGNTLKYLDETIILQQHKLDQLKNMKQVLLQNMFI